MYKLFFKNRDKRYYYGISFEDRINGVLLALEFKGLVPFIMITNGNDYSVFESELGDVVHPENQSFDDVRLTGRVADLMPSDIEGLVSLIDRRNQIKPYDKEFLEVEALVIASAIRLDIDLYKLGWEMH